jgi:Zn-dependent oligopeptidase
MLLLEKQTLQALGRHYQTGQPLPEATIDAALKGMNRPSVPYLILNEYLRCWMGCEINWMYVARRFSVTFFVYFMPTSLDCNTVPLLFWLLAAHHHLSSYDMIRQLYFSAYDMELYIK